MHEQQYRRKGFCSLRRRVRHIPEPGAWEAGAAYLADAADTHVQGVGVATSSIQYLRCKLHHQVLSPCVTLERTRGSRIIIPWKPLIITSLILNIIVG